MWRGNDGFIVRSCGVRGSRVGKYGVRLLEWGWWVGWWDLWKREGDLKRWLRWECGGIYRFLGERLMFPVFSQSEVITSVREVKAMDSFSPVYIGWRIHEVFFYNLGFYHFYTMRKPFLFKLQVRNILNPRRDILRPILKPLYDSIWPWLICKLNCYHYPAHFCFAQQTYECHILLFSFARMNYLGKPSICSSTLFEISLLFPLS